MRVLSWRSLSLSTSDFGDLSLETWLSSAKISPLLPFVFPLALLTGCTTTARPDFVFNRQGLSQQQYSRAEAECELEAEKAAIQAKNSVTAGENWRKIFVLCMEAKGARFLGTTDQFPGLKQ
jgi:hypothetical protein